VKGKLQSLPEEMQTLMLNLSYYTDVAQFQKVGVCPSQLCYWFGLHVLRSHCLAARTAVHFTPFCLDILTGAGVAA